jgi:hypothetical protein
MTHFTLSDQFLHLFSSQGNLYEHLSFNMWLNLAATCRDAWKLYGSFFHSQNLLYSFGYVWPMQDLHADPEFCGNWSHIYEQLGRIFVCALSSPQRRIPQPASFKSRLLYSRPVIPDVKTPELFNFGARILNYRQGCNARTGDVELILKFKTDPSVAPRIHSSYNGISATTSQLGTRLTVSCILPPHTSAKRNHDKLLSLDLPTELKIDSSGRVDTAGSEKLADFEAEPDSDDDESFDPELDAPEQLARPASKKRRSPAWAKVSPAKRTVIDLTKYE